MRPIESWLPYSSRMGLFALLFTVGILGLEVWAFIDVWRRPLGAFPAVSTWPKMAWLILFAVGALLSLVALGLFQGLLPAGGLFTGVDYLIRLLVLLLVIYYLADVRRKLDSLS
jgi:hypothetical protein